MLQAESEVAALNRRIQLLEEDLERSNWRKHRKLLMRANGKCPLLRTQQNYCEFFLFIRMLLYIICNEQLLKKWKISQ